MNVIARKLAVAALFFFIITASLPLPAGADEAVRATLKNGLRVVIVRNALAPVVTTEMNYLVGANETPPGFPGTAHAVEHMMFRGSRGLSASQLSSITASMGGSFGANTRQTITQYTFTVPAGYLDVALRIEAVRMRSILGTEKLWKKERGAIEQEVAGDLSNPEYILYKKLLETMFRDTPYSRDALGDRPSFDKTPAAMLREFHDTWYAPNNAVLVIVGDVAPDRALKEVEREFGSIPAKLLPPRREVKPGPLRHDSIILDTDFPYGLAVAAYRLPGFDSPDFAASVILVDALGNKRGNLYGLVTSGQAIDADFSLSLLPGAAVAYAMAAFPRGEDGAALVAAVKAIISGYVQNGIPEDLVEAAKRREIAEAEFKKNSIEGLASEWSDSLALEGRSSPDEDIEAIRKVTVEDVNRAARKYLVNETAVDAVLTPRESGRPVEAKSIGGKESFAPRNAKPVRLPQWARKVESLPPLPRPGVKPTDITLPNGLRLIVRTSDISPTVSVFGRVKSNPGMEEPQGKEGVSMLLDGLLSYGTKDLDRSDFIKETDTIGADVSVGNSFSLKVTADRLDRGIQLLADNLLHPALPGDAFKVVQKETIGLLEGKLRSPDYLARRELIKALYPKNDPLLREPTPLTVGGITPDDVGTYYGKTFRPDLTTVVVIGKVTPEEAKRVISKYFGEWSAEGQRPVTDAPPVPLSMPSSFFVPDESRVQDSVILAQTLGLTRSDPDYYRLQLGNHVLSGAFYATRLYHELREQRGLVYSVDSFIQAGKTRSLFGVYYACDPPNVAKTRDLVERDLERMRTRLVPTDELRRARTLLVREIPLGEAGLDGIAAGLLGRAAEGLPLDENVQAARRYLKITPAEVRDAFRRRVRPSGFVQVTQGPNPL